MADQAFATFLVFGPVFSRRLGRSLGINHLPPKTCTYACIYCQVGRTTHLQIHREVFYTPEEIEKAVREKIRQAEQIGASIDYLTLVPDGEPTLDLRLKEIIEKLQELPYPVAVITNASLLWQEAVRQALFGADWVSVKVDAADESVWRQVNRPHGRLNFQRLQNGLRQFARDFPGMLVTETMLVNGVNDHPKHLKQLAHVLEQLSPRVAYLSVPTRPPAEASVQPPPAHRLLRAYRILSAKLPRVELLIQAESSPVSGSGKISEALLAITAVHPLREKAVREMLRKAGRGWEVVDTLVQNGQLKRVAYRGEFFYLRNFEPFPGRGRIPPPSARRH